MTECERCGDETDWDGIVMLHNLTGRVVDNIDICVSCAEDLLEWIDAGDTDE